MELQEYHKRNEAIARMLGWTKYAEDQRFAGQWYDTEYGVNVQHLQFGGDWNALMRAIQHVKYNYADWKITSHQFLDDEKSTPLNYVYTGEYWCMIHNDTAFASNMPFIDITGCETELEAVFIAISDFAKLPNC